MKFANITLGIEVDIDPTTSINNVIIGDHVRIAKRCSIYGGPDNVLELGDNSYVGMSSILNGFAAKLTIGKNVSISQFVNIMVDSGPNASPGMQKIFPLEKGPISIGNDCWIGASAIIMPNVVLGEYCIVASNTFVNKSFPAFSIIGGTPARLIRSFTETEKEKIFSEEKKCEKSKNSDYEKNYLNLPFESALREYRKISILDALRKYPHTRILEIGCGADPLFQYIDDYDRMVVIEPGELFYEMIQRLLKDDSNILVIKDLVENVACNLHEENFDFIIIGGFLHEIDNPEKILEVVRNLCSEKTILYTYVPNAKSFHRLLAYKMGIIENIYQKSGHDDLFTRQNVYNKDTFNELLLKNNFRIVESGSYFVKPFTHDQMEEMLTYSIIDKSCLDGLDKMTDFLPDMGSELWNICKKND